MENESPDNKAAEQAASYSSSKGIKIFSSFIESQNDQYMHWAELSPEKRLSEFFDIMSRFYVFTKPHWKGTKITIDQ